MGPHEFVPSERMALETSLACANIGAVSGCHRTAPSVRRERRHTASDDKGVIVKLAHSWVLSPVDAATATLAGVNWVQRVNLVVGTLGLVLLVASVIERRWLVVLAMVLVVPAQAITFLGERRRSRGQR